MKLEGGCYCRKVRYIAEGEPRLRAECLLPRMPEYQRRRAQPVHADAARRVPLYVSGEPKTFTRSDLDQPVTREFCETCGTHLTTRRPALPFVILKIGTLDDPGSTALRKWRSITVDKQPFHVLPEGLPAFERLPPR